MRHAKVALGAAGLAFLVACAASSAESNAKKNGDGPSDAAGGAPGASAAEPGPVASGVIIVHAAAFPSFRLCFENYMDRPPMPDSEIMPQANVVGVEMGSLVRLDPFTKPPGQVYVITEADVRSTPGNPTELSCRERLAPTSNLVLNSDYHLTLGKIDQPLGVGRVSVLAITGCGGLTHLEYIERLSTAPRPRDAWRTYCRSGGATWDETSGGLEAKVFDLSTSPGGTTAKRLPVQLFQLSAPLAQAGPLQVTFGALKTDAGAAQNVPAGTVFQAGPQTALDLEQSSDTIYGEFGFRIRAGTVAVDHSLAEVQELSAPSELPTTYYRVASNYALLLLGDPTHKPGDPIYNPRRAVHMLAVPVLDPEKADAGAADAGDGG